MYSYVRVRVRRAAGHAISRPWRLGNNVDESCFALPRDEIVRPDFVSQLDPCMSYVFIARHKRPSRSHL